MVLINEGTAKTKQLTPSSSGLNGLPASKAAGVAIRDTHTPSHAGAQESCLQ